MNSSGGFVRTKKKARCYAASIPCTHTQHPPSIVFPADSLSFSLTRRLLVSPSSPSLFVRLTCVPTSDVHHKIRERKERRTLRLLQNNTEKTLEERICTEREREGREKDWLHLSQFRDSDRKGGKRDLYSCEFVFLLFSSRLKHLFLHK